MARKPSRIPRKRQTQFSPGFKDDEVKPNWIWRRKVPQEHGIPYASLRAYEKKSFYLCEIGQSTPRLTVHKVKNKYVFYELEQILELKKMRSYLKK